MGIGSTTITAQTDAYKFQEVPFMMPVSCDGIHIEILAGVADFKWLTHSQHGLWKWVKVVDAHWTATSITGEVFTVNEHDPGIEFLDENGNQIKETGTWRVILNGDRGSHYKITWTYTFLPNDPDEIYWYFSLLDAKCH